MYIYMYIVMYMTDGHIQCCHSVTITCTCAAHRNLWDYLLLRMEGEVLGGMQGLQGTGGWSGGSSAVVSWHDDMEEPDDFTKVQ